MPWLVVFHLQRREVVAFVSTCLVCLTTNPVAGSLAQELDKTWDEIAIEWRKNDSGIEGVRASFAVRATRGALWTVLLDYSRFSEVFRNVRQASVLKESPAGAEVEFVVNAKIFDLHYVLDRRYLEFGRRITWKMISGDVRAIEGGWTIDDGSIPGLLKVTYESYVDVEWYVPVFAVRHSATGEVREMVRALRARLAETRDKCGLVAKDNE